MILMMITIWIRSKVCCLMFYLICKNRKILYWVFSYCDVIYVPLIIDNCYYSNDWIYWSILNRKIFNFFRFILKVQLKFYFQTFSIFFSQSAWVNIVWFSRWIDTKTRLWKLNVNKMFYGSLSWDCMLPCCLELFILCLFDYSKKFVLLLGNAFLVSDILSDKLTRNINYKQAG